MAWICHCGCCLEANLAKVSAALFSSQVTHTATPLGRDLHAGGLIPDVRRLQLSSFVGNVALPIDVALASFAPPHTVAAATSCASTDSAPPSPSELASGLAPWRARSGPAWRAKTAPLLAVGWASAGVAAAWSGTRREEAPEHDATPAEEEKEA